MADRIVRVIMRGEIGDLVTKLGAAGKAVAATADKVTAVGKESKKTREALTTLGGQAGKVGLAAAVGFGVAVKSAADFNAEMALVKTLSHANASEMDRLSEAALTVGANIGYSAKAVAAGEEELIKAGVSVNDILGGALKGSLDLAAAGQTDVATATSIAAAALTEFGLKGKDIPHVADELAAGADKALGSVEDLGLGLTQSGTTAAQMGLSLEQTVGTLTAFAQAGLIGERGGTTFKQMLLQLAAPSVQAQKLMDKFNISLYNTNGQIKTMPELADNLSKSLSGVSPEARNAALGVIFGARAIQGANILMANGAVGIQDWIDKTNDQGFAAQQAGGKLDSLAGDAKKLGVALQTAFIETGNGSQSPLRALTQDATSAVTAFNKMPDAVHGTVSGLLAITAITGGGLWFGSRVIRGISETRVALDNLGVDATRVGRTMRTAFAAGAIIEGLNIIETSLDGIFNQTLDTSNLGRSLTALGQGKVTGEFLKKYGSDLQGFSDDIGLATDKADAFQRTVGKIPVIGGFIAAPPWQKSVVDAADNLKTLDEALAGLVESGQADQAAAIFDRLTQVAIQNGHSTKDVTDQFEQYEVALGNAQDASLATSGAAKLMSDAMTGLINPTSTMGKTVAKSTAEIEAQAKALKESRKAAREEAHQFTAFGSSLNDSKVSLDSWIKEMAKQATALRDFTKNAQTAGKKGLREGLIKELEAAGPAGALRMKQLADASETEIGRANRAWGSQKRAVKAYVDQVGGVPAAVTTDVHAHTDQAVSAVLTLKYLIDSLHDRDIHIHVTKSTNATLAEATVVGADGLTVPHAASGWTVPGQRHPYGDKTLILAAPGEELITNRHGEADQFRADRAAGRIPAYANGGTAGMSTYSATGQPWSVPAGGGGMSIDYDRLAGSQAGNRLMGYQDTRQAVLWAMRTALGEAPVVRATPDLAMLAGMS